MPSPRRSQWLSSLRVRLPVFFAIPIILVLASFLWMMTRQVEEALVDSGRDRADLAASELAATLEESIGAALEQTTRMAAAPQVRTFVLDTTSTDRDAVIAVISTPRPGLRRTEVWDTAGTQLLELVSAADDTVPGIRAYPVLPSPTKAGVSPFGAVDTFPYFTIVAPITADSSANAAVIGYLRRFARLTSSASERISRLVGEGASFRVGTIGSPVWTDMGSVLELPASWDFSAGSYSSADGVELVGEIAIVHGTPWIVWVGFPRSVVVAPATPFTSRMILLSLLLVAGGVTLVGLLGYRLTQPLRALLNAANRISAGDLSERVQTHRNDEIGQLGDAFNAMVDRVETTHRALRESNDRTQFALATAGIAIWAVDLETGVMSASESMKLVHPTIGRGAALDRAGFLALVDETDRPSLEAVLKGRNIRDDVVDVRYRVQPVDAAARSFEGRAKLVRDSSGRPETIIGVSIDVTERRRLESQLIQAQKMEGIGQLAGGIAHDFNNLLTAILGHANLLMMDSSDDRIEEDVLGIVRAAESAAGLTRQLLTFSRQRIIEPKVIDVNAQISRAEQLLRRLIGEHITIVTKLESGVAPILLDPGNLEQVVVNLAVNARDAMPNGGRLTIATSSTRVGPGFYSEGEEVPPGTYAMLSVTDTGVGMDARTREHLFEPFFTTKPVGHGTGLGLATVFGIVKQAGGHIFVYSEPGHGTVLKLYFPAAGQALHEGPAPTVSEEDYSGSETILVVEDNSHVREIARLILERSGYRVITAANGDEALNTLSHTEAPDLVVSDVIMPGMTGPELRDKLYARHPGLRVIFTSGYAGDALRHHRLDADDIIEKPYSPIDLCRRVREALDQPPGGSPIPAA